MIYWLATQFFAHPVVSIYTSIVYPIFNLNHTEPPTVANKSEGTVVICITLSKLSNKWT